MEKYQNGKRTFSVVIVGGAVAGLTLAHCLDRANIDYVVLEKGNEIAPMWGSGAGQVLSGNGLRILDQLGLLEAMNAVATPWTYTKIFRDDGKVLLGDNTSLLVEKRLGYKPCLLERRLLLQTLYDTQRDKSRILLNKKVTSVVHMPDGVIVSCEDGTEYMGDIAVGADGIRSKVRSVMRERVCAARAGHLLKADVHSISSEFGGIFGVSILPAYLQKRVEIGTFSRTGSKHRSAFFIPLKDGRTVWVLCVQFSQRLAHQLRQRFNHFDLEKEIEKHGDLHLNASLTIKDLYTHATTAKMVAFEEASMDVWTWDRLVCMGDSIHKMTPNIGQGSNQAMESAAVLSSTLNRMLSYCNGKASISEIRSALESYQNQRVERAHFITRTSNRVSNAEAKTSFIGQIIGLRVPLTIDFFAGSAADLYSAAPMIQFLPEPAKSMSGTLGFNPDLGHSRRDTTFLRIMRALPLVWIAMMSWRFFGTGLRQMSPSLSQIAKTATYAVDEHHSLIMHTRYCGIPPFDRALTMLVGVMMSAINGIDSMARVQAIAFTADLLPVISICWVEAIRRGNSLTMASILAPMLFGLSYQWKGLCIVAPLYYLIHYIQTPITNFYAQDMRLVNMARVKTIIPVLTIGYTIPALLMFTTLFSASRRQYANAVWQLHPLWLSTLSFAFSRTIRDTTPEDRIHNPTADILYLRALYVLSFATAATTYLALWLTQSPPDMYRIFFSDIFTPPKNPWTYLTEVTGRLLRYDHILAFAAGLYWTTLHVLDMRRAGFVKIPLSLLFVLGVSGVVFIGPGAVMVAGWAWREEILLSRRSNEIKAQLALKAF